MTLNSCVQRQKGSKAELRHRAVVGRPACPGWTPPGPGSSESDPPHPKALGPQPTCTLLAESQDLPVQLKCSALGPQGHVPRKGGGSRCSELSVIPFPLHLLASSFLSPILPPLSLGASLSCFLIHPWLTFPIASHHS